MFTVDDGRQRKNHAVTILNDWINWAIFYNWQVVAKMAISLSIKIVGLNNTCRCHKGIVTAYKSIS